MPDLKRIITESRNINDLLRDCYSFVDDKEITERYETSIRELKRRINAIDLCYKENVIDLNDTLEKYLRDYIEYLRTYQSMNEKYRMGYITWRLGKNMAVPDEYEEVYSRMFSEYQMTNPGEKYSEEILIKTIRENVGNRTIDGKRSVGMALQSVYNLNVKYSIFVSSTYEDLKEERLSLMPVLLSKNFIPVGMELFHAAPASQWDVITKMIDGCDYYLLVLGGRYGSVDENEGISYTEKEYNYAKQKNIPIIVFMPSHPEKLTVDKLDRDNLSENQGRLKAFKSKIMNDKNTVAFYENINDLDYKVSVSLDRLIEFAPRDGWVRLSDVMRFVGENKGLQDQIETTKKEVTELRKELESKPNIYIGDSKPENMKEGDIWFGTSDDLDFGNEG